jgi:hypothetical protein
MSGRKVLVCTLEALALMVGAGNATASRDPIVLPMAGAAPGAGAGSLLILKDGQTVHVDRAEELPDRVRVETPTGSRADLPTGVPAERVGPRTFEIPRQHIQSVLPLADPAGAASPQAERYDGIGQQLTDQVHRDLQRSWQRPPLPGR